MTGHTSVSRSSVKVGIDVSMLNASTLRLVERFPVASVTAIVQLLCVPSARELNVIVLFPLLAVVSADEQSPP